MSWVGMSCHRVFSSVQEAGSREDCVCQQTCRSPCRLGGGWVIVPGCFPVSDQMARLRSTAPWPGGTAAGYRGQRWPSERGLKGQREPVIQGDVCVCMDMCVLPCV